VQVVDRARAAQAMDPFDRIAEVDRVVQALEAGEKYALDRTEHRYELEEWQKKIAAEEEKLEKDFKKAKKDREKEQAEAEEKDKEFKEKRYKEDRKPRPPKHDEDAEVVARVVNGELPLVVQVHRAAEIRGLLDATRRFDRLRLVLAGATDAAAFADTLAERRIPVLVWPAPLGEGAPDELDGQDLSLAARLAEAGVPVLIGSGVAPGATRDLPLLAALAIGHGLEREKATEALTLGAARAFDLADRVGSVERGKDADLLLLDGDPLESTTRVLYVVAGGRVVVTPED
jgi:imidazolonepropionase-like amidohydrolase